MIKIFRIIGIVLLIIIVISIGLLFWNSKRQLVSKNYYEKIKTGGEIEAKYVRKGSYNYIQLKEIKVMENFKKYLIYYPEDISSNRGKLPVIIYSNGTGISASRYRESLKRMATWGFVVIGTDEEYSWNGFSSDMCLRPIMKLNTQKQALDWDVNPFYQSIDLDNIGVVGHSQGGVGAINAATENKNSNKVKTVVSLSPANMKISKDLEWDYNPSLINVPTLLISGNGDIDEKLIISGSRLSDIYNLISDDVHKLKMRRNGVDHGEMVSVADGYVTAWFMWQLQGDDEAKKAFYGDNAEILNNKFYQDIDKNF